MPEDCLHTTHIYAKIARDLPQTNGCVCANAGLLIVCCLCKMSQELAVDDSIRKLWHDCEDSSDCLLTNNRGYVSEASDLVQGQQVTTCRYTRRPTI